MQKTILLLFMLQAQLLFTTDGAPTCENGWTPYKDELCITHFSNMESYDSAKAFCATLGGQHSPASLVIVKDAEMQEFLANYTVGLFDYIWLGGRYDANSSNFKWEDGELLTLANSNWMDGYPRNDTLEDTCVEMRPAEDLQKASINTHGKWAHESCLKRNVIMCQKAIQWSLRDAVDEIISLRKQHQEDHKQVEKLQEEMIELQEELVAVKSSVIPIGSIYVEYYGQPSPRNLWPDLMWTDISSTYAGLFFRAMGGGSAVWGTTQDECAPHIEKMEHSWRDTQGYPEEVSLPTTGWSEYGATAVSYYTPSAQRLYESIRFKVSSCQVRPRNQAIRIWKRI